MTKADLEKQVGHWQKRLRLQDWNITVEPVASTAMKDGEEYGEITLDRNEMTAHIKVAGGRPEADVRRTVCHEVCHLLLDGCWAIHLTALEGLSREARQMMEDLYRVREEQIIGRLVNALCAE